jgi:hypothetical protein
MLTRAARVALVVGTFLVVINDFLRLGSTGRIGLTFLVPFLVSMYSMLGMVPELRPGQRSPTGGAYRCRKCRTADQGEALAGAGDPLPPCPQCGRAAHWIAVRG